MAELSGAMMEDPQGIRVSARGVLYPQFAAKQLEDKVESPRELCGQERPAESL